MSGTISLNTAQFDSLRRSVEETGVGVIEITLNPGNNGIVQVNFKTPFGELNFKIDRNGKRLPRA
jgi:H2-forming N5,N10-methylenetetrahydromethanopterin dehydrogenase-like enzyme